MALDRQRILDELGSVVNQLQSAECGCMGNLFSKPGLPRDQIMKSSQPTCGRYRHGCCHGHGCGHPDHYSTSCGAPSAGEPYPSNMNRPCVTYCNPPKLYADTYSYLNQNLMQPVVKEVYDDLKSISPANTVMNNPIANLMGLSNQGVSMDQNDVGNGMQQTQMAAIGGNAPGNMQNQSVMNPSQPGMGQMGGMGPNIVNMIMSNNGTKPNIVGQPQGQGEPLASAMDTSKSAYGQLSTTSNSMSEQEHYSESTMQCNNDLQMQNPTKQYMTRSQFGAPNRKLMAGGSAQMSPQSHQLCVSNPIHSNQNVSPNHEMTHLNPAQQMSVGKEQARYGAHSQGISKFNEIFPGVMQGMGGDLGFDPMAIAIQMNPANQQKVAMDNMHKLMKGNGINRAFDSSSMRPVLTGTNATAASLGQNAPPINNQAQFQSSSGNDQFLSDQQQLISNNELAPTQRQPQGAVPRNQQHIYTAYNTASTINQPPMPNQQPQQVYDPNMEAGMMQQDNAQLKESFSQQQLVKEPIFPADSSKNLPLRQPSYTNHRPYEYNALGQSVEMLPAKLFHTPVSNLPQTLSPQDAPTRLKTGQVVYSNVKPTVSKTSIVGNRSVGKTPSRSQLQHIYNQYKGSQSYTHQNINQSAQNATHSDGKLNVTQKHYNQGQVAAVERVGGDTSVNNQLITNQTINKYEQVTGQIGDVPVAKTIGDGSLPEQIPTANNSKCRNGLQDMVYTAYPTSAAWSFHGNRMPYSAGHRFRRRA